MDPLPPPLDQPLEFRKKDGSPSKMRSHRGNIPVLPQTKLCPHCPAKFTRTTHLNRHLRTHTNERLHRCEACGAEFTRSDLLTRHKRSCNDPSNPNRSRKKSCQPCSDSKIKCDNKFPCTKCTARGRECVFLPPSKRNSVPVSALTRSPTNSVSSITSPPASVSDAASPSPSTSISTPSTTFAPTPETNYSQFIGLGAPRVFETDEQLSDFSAFHTSLRLTTPELSTKPPDSRHSPDFFSSVTSDSATDVESLGPVHSHLSSMYSSDMFEPFFSTLFAQSSSSPPNNTLGDDFPWRRSGSPEEFPFAIKPSDTFTPSASEPILDPSVFGAAFPSVTSLGPEQAQNPPVQTELDHYLYLFFSAFLPQIPIVHAGTFKAEGKPQILLSAMQACGALFVKTRKAATFITNTLTSAREILVQEFATYPTDSTDQVHLILAVVLLQTIGLFHQQQNQRASSSIYHGMLIMMIRRTNLIQRNASWTPSQLAETPLEQSWNEWAKHEMTKRALLLSYLHDCCHCIYFALPPSYLPGEVELFLPCDEGLWRPNSASEWFMALQSSTPYGDPTTRLVGQSMPKMLDLLSEPRMLEVSVPLNPFAHFVLVHAMLYQLFTVCVDSRLPKQTIVDNGSHSEEHTNQQILRLQFALHNWLHNWVNSPESPKPESTPDEPPFIFHALPFYWLGQVVMLAYQEGLPPFEHNSTNNLNVEVRFKMVKQWLKHIRGFLRRSDGSPTMFWDELMKIRLQTSRPEGREGEDQEGLLGFFPEY
ncbi:hypothetical protein HGRIS_002379 [Hohenbuehelia grisea]|uniref:Uncharacterized protein n=1 Tax=Hohenbuehelia grisea TaxID=104357 RepID=A0ABR3JKC4_9AGAR